MGLSWDIAPIANTMVAEGYVLPWLNPLFWEATFFYGQFEADPRKITVLHQEKERDRPTEQAGTG